MEAKRHTCIVCNRKKAEYKMLKHRSHWTCDSCISTINKQQAAGKAPDDLRKAGRQSGGNKLRVLNLYAGVGGNRNLWPDGIQVTAIEYNPKIAAEYKRLYPNDQVLITDAHQYLLKNYNRFDFIWSSPPCQSHSNMQSIYKNKYPDMSLYQEIILLRTWFKGKFVIENVNPYYDGLIKEDHKINRHLFWCNFKINQVLIPGLPGMFNFGLVHEKKNITEWLGFTTSRNLYSTSKNSLQVLRNCVHPKIGLSIYNDFIKSLKDNISQ